MSKAGYTLTEASAERDESGAFVSAAWRATFTDAEGREHWWKKVYAFTPSSEWTPTAAALLASAKTDAEAFAAIKADADRCLSDLLDPANPAGRPQTTTVSFPIPKQE